MGNSRFKVALFFLVILSVVIRSAAWAQTCQPQAALAKHLWAEGSKKKQVVVVEPFSNQTPSGREGWLALGLPELIGELISTSKRVSVLYGISRSYPPVAVAPSFVVTGSYRRGISRLEVYVQVSSGNNLSKALYQGGFSITPPNTGRVLIETGKVVSDIFTQINLSYDKKAFKTAMEATLSFDSYQAYIKGLEAMWTFDPNRVEVANVWFTEAKKHDPYYEKIYIAQENMYGYNSLLAKNRGQDFAPYLQILEMFERDRLTFRNRPSPIPKWKTKVKSVDLDPKTTNRYLIANAHYIGGLNAMQNGNVKMARKEFEKTIKYVPEDNVAASQLYHIYIQEKKNSIANKMLEFIGAHGICY